MKEVELETRANNIEAAICKRTGISNEQYMMLFFETGCQSAEKFHEECGTLFQVYSAKDFMSSNVYWYWWAQKFMQGCEMFLNSSYQGVKVLETYLKILPWPSKDTCQRIIMELNLKKQQSEQRKTPPAEAAGYRTIAGSI